MRDSPLHLIDFDRHAADLHPQRRACFVDDVDGLVRQEAIADVSVRQNRGGHDRRVLDANSVVNLVLLFQAAEYSDRVVHRRLAHQHRLETPRESRVLFHVLAVFRERRRADAAQIAARQRRFQHVGRVDRAFGRARAHQRMQFIDEANQLAVGIRDFLQDGLETVLEFAPELGPGDHGTEIERQQPLIDQLFRHVALDDPVSEPFHNSRLTDAGLADQNRVVLRTAAKYLHHTPDLFIPADDRVKLALTRHVGQIDRVALQRLVLRFGILIRDALRTSHRRERFQDGVVIRSGALQQTARRIVFLLGDGQQQMLGRDEFVLETLGFLESRIEHLVRAGGDHHADLRAPAAAPALPSERIAAAARLPQ